MRTNLSVVYVASALVALGAGMGCSSDLCEYVTCIGAGGAGGTGASTSTSTEMTTSSTTSMSSSTGLPQQCDPLQLMAGESIAPSCGLFVEPGANGDGKQSEPFGTLAEALLNNPMKYPIYVCSTASGVEESITLVADEKLIGALTCKTWTAVGAKTLWTAAQGEVPLTLDKTMGVLVQGFAITAAAASGSDGATLQGNSSIGVIAAQSTATFENVDIVAGVGAAAAAGMSETGTAPGRQSMASSFDGKAGVGCNVMFNGGAATVFPMCPAGGGPTEGGKGGDGASGSGAGGLTGLPNFSAQEPNGTAGVGDTGTAGWTCANGMGTGENGHNGENGNPGPGGTMNGSIQLSGYAGDAGKSGTVGGIGQGGGGGGGLRGGTTGGCSAGQTGPGGGGGGAGGCGGLGGGGGGAGGASIALVSLDATLTLTNVHLTAAAGGAGGNGGSGQLGGAGGLLGPGGGLACNGGTGGNGGSGAGGGGGKGGPSVGLAYVGTAPAIPDANITVAVTPASGGLAGGGSVPGIQGAAGAVSLKLEF